MTDKELLQQALDALEKHVHEYEAIEALRTALAKPEPEPWGYISHKWWMQPVFFEANDLQAANLPHNNPNYTPVYKAPPKKEWVGLTCGDVVDAEQECKHTVDENGNIHFADNADFAHAIEAKLKAKNA